MLTKKQYQLLMFINKTLKETGVSPSFDEMKDAVNLKSKSGIHRLISSLEERGFIRKLPHRARALEILKLPKTKPSAIVEEEKTENNNSSNDNVIDLPLYGKIAAGTPIEAIRDENEKFSIPNSFVGLGEHYALTVDGDSMVDAGIQDGDTVIIKKAQNANNGEIVVALVDGQEVTLKTLKKTNGEVWLIPHNEAYEIRKLEPNRVSIQGILSGLVRKY
jgi:repressor LexA